MLYVQSAVIYIINHLIVTAVRAGIRQKNYKYKYGGNTTLQKCIKRRIFRIWTFIYAVIATLTVIFLLYIQ